MEKVIKREEASEIRKNLNASKSQLLHGNIYSCLVSFREVLENMLTKGMLASDEKDLQSEINLFQQRLAASRTFRDVYGPVTFRDNDIATALDFLKQLIHIKDEETRSLLDKESITHSIHNEVASSSLFSRARQIKGLIERGDFASAQEGIAENGDLIDILITEYNASGIEHRRANRFDEAISEFKKAIVVNPRDEGLYYNVSRAYISKEEWKTAAETIVEGLTINPHFTEGIQLLKYIRETGGIDM